MRERTVHRKEKPNRVLMALSKLLERAAEKSYQPKSILRRSVSALLELAAFILLTYAGWQISSVAGTFIAAGSCLVLSWHVGSGSAPQSGTDPTLR
jgi:hypothetical protein